MALTPPSHQGIVETLRIRRRKDRTLKSAIMEIHTLFKCFANGQSMSIVVDLDAYVQKVLLEPWYILEPDRNTQACKLHESGRHFYDEMYKS